MTRSVERMMAIDAQPSDRRDMVARQGILLLGGAPVNRREFITLLGGVAVLHPRASAPSSLFVSALFHQREATPRGYSRLSVRDCVNWATTTVKT
jgi:hypothetical protein